MKTIYTVVIEKLTHSDDGFMVGKIETSVLGSFLNKCEAVSEVLGNIMAYLNGYDYTNDEISKMMAKGKPTDDDDMGGWIETLDNGFSFVDDENEGDIYKVTWSENKLKE